MSTSDPDSVRSDLATRANLLGLGWQIATTLLVFTGLGYLLDKWLDTLPWFLVTGALLGMVSIFYQVLRIVKELDRAEMDRKRKKKQEH